MPSSEPVQIARSPRRIRWSRVAGLLVAAVAIGAAAGQLSSPSSSSTSTFLTGAARHDDDGPLGAAGGAVPDGTSVFDDRVPGVAKLDPALHAALRRAATDAARDGVRFVVNSGWRSAAYEDELRRQAIAKYGSEAEAARWVATGDTSPHVSGDAVDLGPTAAAAWLGTHGVAYGLCRIYANEPWHFELRPGAVDRGCPAMYADPTHDPRMRR